MKKSALTLSAVLMLTAMHVFTQQLPPRWSLGLAAGPAFTVGNFHRLPVAEDGTSGSGAQSGGSVELSSSYRVWRGLSATLAIEGQENKGYGIPYFFIPPGSNNAIGSSKGEDWKIARVLAGAVYNWPLTKKTGLVLLTRLLGGVQQTISPNYKALLLVPDEFFPGPSNGTGASKVTYPGLTLPWCFSYEVDAGLQWRFRGRFSAVGYIAYGGAKPSINLAHINSVNYVNNTYTTTHQRSAYATSTLALRGGVQYALSR